MVRWSFGRPDRQVVRWADDEVPGPPDDLLAGDDVAEHGVDAVEVRRGLGQDEELGPVRVRALGEN